MTECEAAYAYGKFYGRLETVVAIMKLRIKNQELHLSIDKVMEDLINVDDDMESVCANKVDKPEDKLSEMKLLFEKMEELDDKFNQVLTVVDKTTGIASLF